VVSGARANERSVRLSAARGEGNNARQWGLLMSPRAERGADSRYARWLSDQLPILVSAGVLSEEAAERLCDYYGPVDTGRKRRFALTVCSIFGALSIGLGIILLLAHNWEGISRPVRVVLALLPMVVAQALVGWTIMRRRDSLPWREGTATFLTLAIAAAIALVSQTYHTSGPSDMSNFLLSWMLLSVPLVYLVGATVPALIYLAGITAWAGYVQSDAGPSIIFWPLALVIVPHFWLLIKENPHGIRTTALSWALSVCLPIAVGITLWEIMFEGPLPSLTFVVYSSLFTVLYLAGSAELGAAEQPSRWQRPLQMTGAGGIVVLSFILTFWGTWEPYVRHRDLSWGQLREAAFIPHYVLAAAILGVALWLIISTALRRQTARLFLGIIPVLAAVGCVVHAIGIHATSLPDDMTKRLALIPTIMFNMYLLVLGVATMLAGTRTGSIPKINAGMIVLIALLVARFFDSEMSFTARGVAFIVLGIWFLATNLVFIRRRGEVR